MQVKRRDFISFCSVRVSYAQKSALQSG